MKDKKGQKKRGVGRPRHEPTDRDRGFVQAATMGGIPQDDIAAAIGVSLNTLRKYYADQIEGAMQRANGAVINTAYHMATSGQHPAMTIFWLKTRCGWSEKHHVDITTGGEKLTWRDKVDDVKDAREAVKVFAEGVQSDE